MGYRILLAGATGAIGLRLTPQLIEAGHYVVGTTRSEAKAGILRGLGAEPAVVDVFDVPALMRVATAARPDIVIHQLTDLPKDLDPKLMPEALVRNARIRDEGTRNLVQAAIAAGARRFIAQSIAWTYAPGPEPHGEDDPLEHAAEGERGVTMRGVIALERLTLRSPPLVGVVLRYGQLYGPGTHSAAPSKQAPVHVDAAAHAALLALGDGIADIFNIAEPNAYVATDKARTLLGWRSDYRLRAGAHRRQ